MESCCHGRRVTAMDAGPIFNVCSYIFTTRRLWHGNRAFQLRLVLVVEKSAHEMRKGQICIETGVEGKPAEPLQSEAKTRG